MKTKNNIGLGTAAIGRPLYINLNQVRGTEKFSLSSFKQSGLQLLNAAYASGVRHFDTAPGYGLAEQLLIEWLAVQNDRTITVSTKWGYTYVANFDPHATEHEVKEHSLTKLNEQWEVSRNLLPHLKIYQIHSATFDSKVLKNQAVLERLHELKKEHNLVIGLTTTGDNQVDVLEKAMQIFIKGEKLFQSYQCTFNILDQSVARYIDVLKDLKDNFIIKEALANGRLIPNRNFANYTDLYKYMKQLSEKYDVGPDAVALAYCAALFPQATVLSGANNTNHLEANLKSNSIDLTRDELDTLKTYSTAAQVHWKERKNLEWN